uniref:TIL domain-containing protein n=2 Tax=Parascaris univalens TaxID=6257 RepID=A0A915AAL5_PARUN
MCLTIAVRLLFVVALVIGAQPHLSRCPELNEAPPASNDGCNWVVVVDFRGCRTYVEECGQPNECTGEAEMLWKCSSKCPPTCAEKWPGCEEQCGPPQCQCVGGYVRNEDGKCIKIFDCPNSQPQCAANEVFSTCSKTCEHTCYTPMNIPCPSGCGPPRCECIDGYVRHNGACVAQDQCPSSRVGEGGDLTLRPLQQQLAHLCTLNEEFVECSSMCEPTCTSPPGQSCTLVCGPSRCQCRQGFVRHLGQCILRSQCNARGTCAGNEVFNICSSLCEPTCFTNPNERCPAVCGPPKCQCRPGLVRHGGVCIWRDHCPPFEADEGDDDPMLRAPQPPASFRCGRNEEYVRCSSMCEPTCTSPPNQRCTLACGPAKCQCRPGYVRHRGDCIPSSQCPRPERCRSDRDCPRFNECIRGYCQVRRQGGDRFNRGMEDEFGAVDEEPLLEKTLDMAEQQRVEEIDRYRRCGSNRDCPRGYYCRNRYCYRWNYRDEADTAADAEVSFWEANERADTPRCGNNEVFARCSSRCEPTCFSHPDENCGRTCGPPKCECRPGYYRYQRRCVSRNQCPRLERCRTNSNCPRNYVCRGGWCYQSMRSWRSDDGTLPSDVIDEEPNVADEQPANKPAFPLSAGELICEKEAQCPSGMDCINGVCVELQQANAANTTASNQLKACSSENSCEGGATCFEGFCHFVETKR